MSSRSEEMVFDVRDNLSKGRSDNVPNPRNLLADDDARPASACLVVFTNVCLVMLACIQKRYVEAKAYPFDP